MSHSIAQEYFNTAIRRFKSYKNLGDESLSRLSQEQLHYSPNEVSNSASIIVQHLWGNMRSRWTNFLTEHGEKTWRERDKEFERIPYTKQEILNMWEEGWHCLLNTLHALTENDLLKEVSIRNEPLTVMDAINRQLAHYSYHVGQIVYLAKMLSATEWKSLSIPKGKSEEYNNTAAIKDPAKRY